MLRELGDGVPSIFKRFYLSRLYDNLLSTFILYFVAIFQSDNLKKVTVGAIDAMHGSPLTDTIQDSPATRCFLSRSTVAASVSSTSTYGVSPASFQHCQRNLGSMPGCSSATGCDNTSLLLVTQSHSHTGAAPPCTAPTQIMLMPHP